jgi:sodium/proline symporter
MGILFTIAYRALEFAAFSSYFIILAIVVLLSYRKQKSEADYILGNRSLNFWLTALSAHASDMSSWLFLGYPALIFTTGVTGAWAAIGLVVCMFLNWQFVAPKIRAITEETNSLTLSSYFENRFGDTSGKIRIVSAVMSIFFFTFYISSGLVGMGILVESLFGISYSIGISLGLFIVVAYVFLGGYRTVAWIDLFQGFFLLAVIVAIPTILIIQAGGMAPVLKAVAAKGLPDSLLPDFTPSTIFGYIMIALGWGLGYFGQPHIITKFMGIRRVSEIKKAQYLGMSWQTIALLSATLIGLLGIYIFPQGSDNPEHVILDIVKTSLPTFFSGLVLCAILAATTNVMAAQILVVASNLSEDFYKRLLRKQASPQELLWVSRSSVVFISIVAYIIAFFKISSIYQLVFYSWSGLGASFGPLVLLSLYRKGITRQGAFAGILVGGISAGIWYYYNHIYHQHIDALIVGFILGAIAIELVSYMTRKKNSLPS